MAVLDKLASIRYKTHSRVGRTTIQRTGSRCIVAAARRITTTSLLLLSLLAGCHERPPHLLGLDDGVYLRGPQVSTVEPNEARGARRAEFYIDGLRIAVDEIAPFKLDWDTRDFVDGRHQLATRVDLGDGSYLDETLTIWIDNTPPALGDLPTTALQGRWLWIPADDNLGVAQVEVSRGLPDEVAIVLTKAPYAFMWPWACGQVALHIRVVDRAGGENSATVTIASGVNENDQDCDGHIARTAGGDDCNDSDSTIYGGATEYPDGVDRNCDGVTGRLDGVDADHDGVASVASGGADCDDNDPAIHGNFLVLAHRRLVIDGKPLQWSPGEAAFEAAGPYYWSLILNRGGIVQRVSGGRSDMLAVSTVATDANPGSLAVWPGYVAYGRGNQVVIIQQTESGWTRHGVIDADAPVGRLAFEPPHQGSEYAVFQAGTKVWFAAASGGSAWTLQLLIDAEEPLAEAPVMSAAPYGADVLFRTDHTAWKSSRIGVTDPLTTHTIGPSGVRALAIAQYSSSIAVVAVEQGDGAMLYGDQIFTPIALPRRVTHMSATSPYLFVELEGLGLQILNLWGQFRKVQSIPDVSGFDTAFGRATFAGNGQVYYSTDSSVWAPSDTPGDGIDRNCDGSDY